VALRCILSLPNPDAPSTKRYMRYGVQVDYGDGDPCVLPVASFEEVVVAMTAAAAGAGRQGPWYHERQVVDCNDITCSVMFDVAVPPIGEAWGDVFNGHNAMTGACARFFHYNNPKDHMGRAGYTGLPAVDTAWGAAKAVASRRAAATASSGDSTGSADAGAVESGAAEAAEGAAPAPAAAGATGEERHCMLCGGESCDSSTFDRVDLNEFAARAELGARYAGVDAAEDEGESEDEASADVEDEAAAAEVAAEAAAEGEAEVSDNRPAALGDLSQLGTLRWFCGRCRLRIREYPDSITQSQRWFTAQPQPTACPALLAAPAARRLHPIPPRSAGRGGATRATISAPPSSRRRA